MTISDSGDQSAERQRVGNGRGASGRILLALAFLAAAALAGCGGVDEQASMDLAAQSIDGGDYRTAMIELQKVLSQNPSNAEAEFLLGTVYLQMGRGVQAETSLKEALSSGIPLERILIPLGEALLLQGRFDDLLAELTLEKARELRLEPETLVLRGNAQLGLDEMGAAEASFSAALELESDSVAALEGLARIALGEGELDAASVHLEKALALAPDNVELWLLQAGLALQQADNEAALAAADKALELAVAAEPTTKELQARLTRAEALQALGDPEAAEQELDRALERAPGLSLAYYAKARIAYAVADYEQAERELREVRRLAPEHLPSLFLLGATHYAKTEYSQAEELLVRYLAERPDDKRARSMLVNARLRQERPAEALAALAPMDAELAEGKGEDGKERSLQLALRGTAQLALGDAEAAEASFLAALELEPVLIPALEGQLRIDAARGDAEGAAARVDAALQQAPEEASLWLLKGKLSLAQGDNAAALEAYDRALDLAASTRQQDKVLEARLGRARVLQITGDLDAARKEVDAVLEQAPERPMAHYLSAALAYAQDELAHAEPALQEVLALAPEHGPSLLLLGATQYRQQNDAQAAEALAAYLTLSPADVRARKLLAATRLRQGMPGAALEVLEPVQAQADKDRDLLLLFARAAAGSRQNELALEYFQRAAVVDPDDEQIRLGLARAQLRAGDSDEAIATLSGLQDPEAPGSKLMLASAYLDKGDIAAARAVAAELQQESADSAVVQMLAGRIELAAGDAEAAERALRKAIEVDAEALSAMSALGRMKLEAGALDEAERWFALAREKEPGNAGALMGLAEVAAALGNADQALDLARQARAADEEAVAPRIWLARQALVEGRQEHAIEMLEEIPGARRGGASLALLGSAYQRVGRVDDAIRVYRRLHDEFGKSEPLMLRIAALESEQGRQLAARLLLEEALEQNAESVAALALLAQVESRAGRLDRGLQLAQEIQRIDPESALGYGIAGDIQAKSGDAEAALKSYRAAAEREPSRELVIKRHAMLARLGEDSAANELLIGWLDANPQDIALRLLLATRYQEQGQRAEAIRAYEEILDQRPEHAAALNNLALAVFPNDQPRGLDHARRAIELAPDNPAIKDTYGWLVVESGRPGEGLEYLEQAAEALGDPTVRYHLAVALSAIGYGAMAERELAAALAAEGAFAEREAAEQMLREIREAAGSPGEPGAAAEASSAADASASGAGAGAEIAD